VNTIVREHEAKRAVNPRMKENEPMTAAPSAFVRGMRWKLGYEVSRRTNAAYVLRVLDELRVRPTSRSVRRL